jgi:uncharacterized protein
MRFLRAANLGGEGFFLFAGKLVISSAHNGATCRADRPAGACVSPRGRFLEIGSIVLLLAGAYGVLVLAVYLYQPRLLYFPNLPSREITATPAAIGLAYETVSVTTDDHVTLDGWFVPASRARGVLLFCHGNAGNISHRLDSLKIFNDLGLSTLIFDYRGYGRSEGSPSEEGTYRDAQAVWRYLTETRAIAANRIVLFGRSLGASIAAHLASQTQPAALIVESAFTSAPDLAQELYPFLPARALSRFRYDTRASLRSVGSPVLVIHSRDDEIIPFSHGQALYAAAPGEKQFLELRGSHNEGFLLTGEKYREALARFLTKRLGNES